MVAMSWTTKRKKIKIKMERKGLTDDLSVDPKKIRIIIPAKKKAKKNVKKKTKKFEFFIFYQYQKKKLLRAWRNSAIALLSIKYLLKGTVKPTK